MAQDYATEGEDLYSDTPTTVAPPAPEEAVDEAPAAEEMPEEAKEDAKGEDRTALLPKAVFAGKDIEPGTRCEVEVVRVHDDEVEVKYVPHKSSSAPAKAPPVDELAALME